MSTITLPAKANEHPQVRSLNILRDLPTVADLIELCFSSTMDNDGQRYLSDMRRAGHDDKFLRWANHMADTTSLPLTGYVWEENNKIVGNASLIQFRDAGRRIHLIANVATHPDHRRRGIARILTQRAMDHARKKNTTAIWLHVRDDNPGAIKLYEDLGFHEVARRTTWQANPDLHLIKPYTELQIVPRHPRFWSQQEDWLRRLYPEALSWYQPLSLHALRPGLFNWLYLLFMDFNIKQWAAVRGDELLATLTWMPQGGRIESMYGATAGRAAESLSRPNEVETRVIEPREEALTQLLIHARRVLSNHATLSLDYPAGEMTEAILAAGFKLRRTLIWMRA
jgi:ribosomal protein S18 acetylase RimI-like enzyme